MIKSIELKNLSIDFKNRPAVINECNLKFIKGKTYLLSGKTASGKSTLLKFLKGIIPLFYPATISGEILVNNKSVSLEEYWNIRKEIGYLFQDPPLQVIGSSVETDIAFGLENIAIEPFKMRDTLEKISKQLNITHLLSRSPTNLSGGELALVALASILVLNPQILLLDEFTAFLDNSSRNLVFKTIKMFQGTDRIILIVSHHLREVLPLADEVIILEEGKVVLQKPKINFMSNYYTLAADQLRIPELYDIGTQLCIKAGVEPNFDTVEELLNLLVGK